MSLILQRSSIRRPFVLEIIRTRGARKSNRFVSPLQTDTGVLALIRHGESEFNKEDRFTGLRDPDLTALGVQQAISAGRTLRHEGFRCDAAFTSKLKRAYHSISLILKELHLTSIPIVEAAALNERDYGELSGVNRDTARARWGNERVLQWRRSYDVAPPGGESLAMTAARTLPFFESRIKPLLLKGQKVLIVAHGNSLRSIVMSLDKLAPDQIVKISFATGTTLLYRFDGLGTVLQRTEIPTKHST